MMNRRLRLLLLLMSLRQPIPQRVRDFLFRHKVLHFVPVVLVVAAEKPRSLSSQSVHNGGRGLCLEVAAVGGLEVTAVHGDQFSEETVARVSVHFFHFAQEDVVGCWGDECHCQ